MERNIVVDGWGDILPINLRYAPVAGEPKNRAYRHKYPYAVIYFKKLKKEYHKEQICTGVKERTLRSMTTGQIYVRDGLTAILELKDDNPKPRYRRITKEMKQRTVIDW